MEEKEESLKIWQERVSGRDVHESERMVHGEGSCCTGEKINMIKNARIWRAGIIKLFGMVHDHRSKR